MKRIKLFEDFIKEDATETDEAEKDFTHLPRLKSVIDKEFFKELKEHIFYWINYDFLNKKYVTDTLENIEDEVSVWFYDNKETPEYQYKVIYTALEEEPMEQRIDFVKMIISIYSYEDNELLKQTEMKVGLKYLNAKSFNNFINKVKKRILKTPKNGEDIDDFKNKEKRRLGDNIY